MSDLDKAANNAVEGFFSRAPSYRTKAYLKEGVKQAIESYAETRCRELKAQNEGLYGNAISMGETSSALVKKYRKLKEAGDKMYEVIDDIIECPMSVDAATVEKDKQPIESPLCVVNISCLLEKVVAAKKALKAWKGEK